MMDMERSKVFLIIGIILVLTFVGGMKYGDMRNDGSTKENDDILLEDANNQQTKEVSFESSSDNSKIKVYVIGTVEKPGVYEVSSDARMYEVVELAEAGARSDLTRINLAGKLEDEQVIVVPSIDDPLTGNAGSAPAGDFAIPESFNVSAGNNDKKNNKVNINTAPVQEMDEKLPGIGPALAQRIVDYRENNGGFKQAEDLMQVSGIGEKRFADLKDLICVK